ncbi:MAG TPA: hypothetical protein VGQ71_12030 [Terriglobales bacterium]|jgi:hypothetical protein|nr:hypothetical protein [Terriglobales bacterium]
MAAIVGSNQSPRITTGTINQAGRTGDPAPGVPVSTANTSGSIVQPYGGMVGGKLTLSAQDAVTLSDPSVRVLYGGVYMYVQFATTSVANAAGQPVFWLNQSQYIVTPNGTGANAAPGGITLCAGLTLNATTPGNYDFIQVAGEAYVRFGGTLAATGAVGDLVVLGAAANPTTGNNTAAAAPITSDNLKLVLGRATRTAPAANGISTVLLGLTPTAWMY